MFESEGKNLAGTLWNMKFVVGKVSDCTDSITKYVEIFKLPETFFMSFVKIEIC